MKKFLVLTLSFFLIFTNISFAEQKDITKTIKDVTMVNDRISIMIKKITGDDPLDIDDFKKEIKFCESILGENSKKMTSLYSNESDIELKRSYSSLLYIMSLYELSLSSMVVYINDDSKTDYFIDTCSSYSGANIALKTITSIYN
ncbi:hypothetical protein [Faecalimicrobium dakarense]|uniref:hypothetical protein n=1 Tax=Faecalimicrobium dakarense TaxID=1301100 RepID=UPI0004B0C37F|nr:hypothetical protein [[Clostridium] dakarense]